MASSTPVCGICDLRSITKPAILWCFECDEGLCSECRDHHSLSKGSRNHDTVKISEYQKLPSDVVKITQNCGKHDEKFTIYCKKHECLCCGSCIVENHLECRDFDKLATIVQNTNFANAFYEIEQSLADFSDNIKNIRNNKEKNLKRLSEKKKEIEQKIKQMRNAIDNHLDKMEDKIMEQLNATEENERKVINNLLHLLKEHESEITEYIKNIENIKQHATELQSLIAMKELEKKIASKDEFIQSVIDSENVKDRELSYDVNAAMQDFVNHIKEFGEVKIETRLCHVVITSRKNNQAQIMLPYRLSKSIDKINPKHLKTINTMGTDTYGCCMLPDGRMAFADYPKACVRVFNSDGSKDFEVETPIFAFDIAYNCKDNSLVVTSGRSAGRCIRIIDIKNKEVTQLISVGFYYSGIAVIDDNVICSVDEKAIQLINLHTNQTRAIVQDGKPKWGCVATLGDTIYHSNYESNSVTCYDIRGTVQWIFKNEGVLNSPRGISVDNDGNVYVVGNSSTNVVVISVDGQQHKEILTARDGLYNPLSLDYNRNTNHLLVANHSKTAMIFTMT